MQPPRARADSPPHPTAPMAAEGRAALVFLAACRARRVRSVRRVRLACCGSGRGLGLRVGVEGWG
eukprot:1099672-Prymnesium_polylepis.2